MTTDKIIEGKHVLVVDDEKDILETLVDFLDICKIDAASSFEEAKKIVEDLTNKKERQVIRGCD